MPTTLNKKLVVAISSRALFDLEDSHAVYEQQGVVAYADYQISNENKVLQPGAAFPLVKKLLALTDVNSDEALVEIILLSRNSTDTGLRIFNSIQQHKLNISCAAFTSGDIGRLWRWMISRAPGRPCQSNSKLLLIRVSLLQAVLPGSA